jgi:hypothetical protein
LQQFQTQYARASAIPVSVARDRGLIPKAYTAILQAFSTPEMKLYKHATTYKWTTDEIVETIKLIKSADINLFLYYLIVSYT